VHFAGWESNTYVLQRNGWEFAVDYTPETWEVRIAIRNKFLKLYAFVPEYTYEPLDRVRHIPQGPPIIINNVVSSIEVLRQEIFEPFTVLDMTPTFREFNPQKVEDLFPFSIAETETVLIERQADMGVVDHLRAILDKQRPKQEEIWDRRKHLRQEEDKPEQNTLLKLVV